ncbi:MAG: chemotaxis protein CheB [Chlorobi bacterium]|nr:chemotaxis protein CheB [Chlorobiota bacterium]
MNEIKYIVIGGSAGSFKIITEILKSLPKQFPLTLILVLHRLKHIKEGFTEALRIKSQLPVSEPFDKEKILAGHVYIAPANYHLYIEPDKTFSLSAEETVNHSRPSIDITLSSAAFSLRNKMSGIILSGANNDGAEGLKDVVRYGGTALVQDPEEAAVATMPESAIKLSETENILSSQDIISYILNIP